MIAPLRTFSIWNNAQPKWICLMIGICLVCSGPTRAQLPERWTGTWSGTMLIYKRSALIDSVPVRLTIARTDKPGRWTWKTEYLSPKRPMTKDYTLNAKDAANGVFVTDEGEGTLLTDYLVGNKLFSVFETEGILLTATYELRGDELIFEVTSGRKQGNPTNGVSGYSVDTVQRVVYRRGQ